MGETKDSVLTQKQVIRFLMARIPSQRIVRRILVDMRDKAQSLKDHAHPKDPQSVKYQWVIALDEMASEIESKYLGIPLDADPSKE